MKSVSGKRFARILLRRGWMLVRITSSHHIFAQPGNPARISVPIHGDTDLKIGLLRSLMKTAGIAEDEL